MKTRILTAYPTGLNGMNLARSITMHLAIQDADGLLMSEERQFGLSAVIKDEFMEGGASIRRSSQIFANFGGAKRLTVASDPPGLLTSSETFPETNSSYTSPNKNGLTNGHYFSHWEINGVRQADSQGLGLSQISLNIDGDKTIIAKYYLENEDTDSDGLPDWFEWHEFGSLDNNASSDPDADGMLMSEERQFGLFAVIKDEFMEGGGSIRRSSTIGYIEFLPSEMQMETDLTKHRNLPSVRVTIQPIRTGTDLMMVWKFHMVLIRLILLPLLIPLPMT
jgi:hypothetical protein